MNNNLNTISKQALNSFPATVITPLSFLPFWIKPPGEFSQASCRIMKSKRGRKVEVLRRTKEQCDSWFPGKIISVEGDRYIVRYELFLNFEGEEVEEKVRHQHVRPQPLPVMEEKRWVIGDIAEVFHLHCWRVGKVVKVLKDGNFVIRLFGSIQLKEFHQSSLRVRQAWKDNNWILLGEVSGVEGNENGIKQNSLNYYQSLYNGNPQAGIPTAICKTEVDGQGYHKSLEGTLKRNRGCRSKFLLGDAVMESRCCKRKPTMKVEGGDKLPIRTIPFSQEVNAYSSQKVDVGKRSIFGYSKLNVQTEKTNDHTVRPHTVPILISEESNECSVASCSSNDFQEYDAENSRKSSRGIAVYNFDDAESFCPSVYRGSQSSSYAADQLEVYVHELELNAYRRTLQAFYASGPLSWEQESLLTNLRLSLRISNEEHLLHLKQLLSAEIL